MKIGWFVEEQNCSHKKFVEDLMKKMRKHRHAINKQGEVNFVLSVEQFILPKEEAIPGIKEKDVFNISISIAMTSHNHEMYIKDAIESVVLQTHKNWELVIVEDGSTDDSLKVIKDYIKEQEVEKKVKIIKHEKTQGYGASLGESIKATTNDLVVILDSDDVLFGDTVFQICIRAHLANPYVSMTYSNYLPCYPDLTLKSKVKTRQIQDDESYFYPSLIKINKMQLKISHLKVLKRKYYDMTEGIDPTLKKTVDKDLVFKLEEVGKFVHIDEYLMLYRKHKDSMAAIFGRSKKSEQKKIEDARQQMFKKTLERRKLQEEKKLKVYLEGSRRDAVRRMFPYWESQGVVFVNSKEEARVRFANVRFSTKSNLPTLVRIDGIYYDKDSDYEKRNADINVAHSTAKAIVYQSDCSKQLCEKHLVERNTDYYQVIHNGIDKTRWHNPIEHDGINIISCSKWRRVKRLPEMIEIFKEFLTHCPEAKLHIIGPMVKGQEEVPCQNVLYYGNLSLNEIKKIYQTGDISLHLCKKDSCPSNVIESIASGVPVVTTNLCGGAAEVCDLTEGCKVIYEGEQNFDADYIYCNPYNEMPIDVKEKFVEAMIGIVKNKTRVDLSEQLTIDYVAQKYLTMLREISGGSL